jgi:flagellar motor switch protein FliN
MIGGGLSGLGDLIGDASMEQAAFSIGEAADALSKRLGNRLTGAEVGFEDEAGRGNAVLVFTDGLAQRAPGLEEPLVSDEEMKDILKDFTPDDEADHTARGNGGALPDNLDVVMDIELVATARLGRVEVPISEVLNYGPGSIIELGHVVDEPIELLVNGKLIARGDVVVVDERFGLRITEIVSPRERIESLR